MGEFKVGDRVTLAGCDFAGIGEITMLTDLFVRVHWDHSGSPGMPFDIEYKRDLWNCGGFKLHSPAPPPADPPPGIYQVAQQMAQQRQQHWTQQLAPEAVERIDGLKERNLDLANQNRSLRSELADVKSERDRLRAEKADLLVSVAFLERENARLTGKLKGCR